MPGDRSGLSPVHSGCIVASAEVHQQGNGQGEGTSSTFTEDIRDR